MPPGALRGTRRPAAGVTGSARGSAAPPPAGRRRTGMRRARRVRGLAQLGEDLARVAEVDTVALVRGLVAPWQAAARRLALPGRRAAQSRAARRAADARRAPVAEVLARSRSGPRPVLGERLVQPALAPGAHQPAQVPRRLGVDAHPARAGAVDRALDHQQPGVEHRPRAAVVHALEEGRVVHPGRVVQRQEDDPLAALHRRGLRRDLHPRHPHPLAGAAASRSTVRVTPSTSSRSS